MRWHSHRVAWITLAIALTLVTGLGAGAWWMVSTEHGARWGFERLGAILPGKLDVQQMKGPLRGPLEVRHVTYRTDRLEITADRLVLEWHLRELLGRKLDIRRLYAEDVRVLVGSSGDRPEERDSLASPFPDVDLPVSIIVRDGLVNHLQITSPGSDSGIVIDRVALQARKLRSDSLRVDQFVVRSHDLDVDVSGVALPRGSYPMALRGRWTYRPASRPPVAGEGTLVGTLDTLRVVQNLSSPFTGHLDTYLYRAWRRMRVLGDLEFSELQPQVLQIGLPAGTYSGRVHAQGDLAAFKTHGSIHGTSEQLGPIRADFDGRRENGTWRVEDLRLGLPGSDTRLSAHGTVTEDPRGPRFRLETEWRDLDWPVRGEPWAHSERGRATIDGTARDFGIKLQALLAGRNIPSGQWELDGRGGDGRLAIHTVVADIMDGRIVGTGRVAWQPRASWNMNVDASHINPGSVWKTWPGDLTFTGQSEGEMAGGGPNGRVLVSHLDGALRDQPIQGNGVLTARDGQYGIDTAAVQWGPNRASARGQFGKTWDLSWILEAPSLTAAIPQASGSLRGNGTIRGTQHQPHFVAALDGDSLFFGELHATTFRTAGDVDLAPGGAINLDAAATGLDRGTHSADLVLLSAHGTREQHEVRASLAGKQDSLVTVLRGGFGSPWKGQVQTLDLVDHRTGNWSLVTPANLTASTDRVELSNLTWGSGAARITAAGEWTRSGPWRVASDLDQVQLALFEPVMPEKLRIRGPVAGHVEARRADGGSLYADVNLVPGPGEILHQTPSGDWVPDPFQSGVVRVRADGNHLDGTLGADLVNNGTIRATLGMPAHDAAALASAPLDGRLAVHLSNLAAAQGLTPELEATNGSLDADLDLGGTFRNPSLYGKVELRDGTADVPRLGIQLREIGMHATGTPAGQLALNGSLRSGSGTLGFDGTASLGRSARPEARIAIKGTRVQAMNTKDARLLMSPDLQATLQGKRVDVTGTVDVPEGLIDVGQGDNPRLVKSSDDVTFSGTDTLSGAPVELHSRVRVVVGDQVQIRGFGLDVHPTGSVLATREPGLPMLGTGQLDVKEGTYLIYGQKLAVDRGRLIFGGGPITNPALSARASRTAPDGVVAGFDVAGTVITPRVTIFSSPPMGQSQALSYILFGRPLERGSLSEGQIASTMATSLGVPGTNLLARGLTSGLGIEEARIEGGGTYQNTSLMLGTHFSQKLYVSYGLGLFDATTALRMKYLINRRLTLEAESANENRLDLLYTVER